MNADRKVNFIVCHDLKKQKNPLYKLEMYIYEKKIRKYFRNGYLLKKGIRKRMNWKSDIDDVPDSVCTKCI